VARFGRRRSEYVKFANVMADIAHPVHNWAHNNRAIFRIEQLSDDDHQGEVTWRFTFYRGDRSRSVDTRTTALMHWWVFRREALRQTGHDLGPLSNEIWKQLCAAALREMRGERAWFDDEVQS
jgi:hypothetical protein